MKNGKNVYFKTFEKLKESKKYWFGKNIFKYKIKTKLYSKYDVIITNCLVYSLLK